MDDLESFFYVLCWICCGYSAPGKRIEDFYSTFASWEHPTAKLGADCKALLYIQPFKEQLEFTVTDYFGDAFLALVGSLQEFFQFYVSYNKDFNGKPPPPTLDSAVETILRHVKTAIACVEAEEAPVPDVRPVKDDVSPATPEPADPHFSLMDPPRVYSTRAGSRASSKRVHDEPTEGEESTSAKKSRSHHHAAFRPSSLSSSSLAADEP